MNILSLFDWISCWRIALERAWIKVDKYYASEIKEDAIKVSIDNYTDIIRLWDITKINWSELDSIDLLIGGSPCQSFSIAWKQEWFDWKSWLFWEYIRLLKETKPKYFLLENVKMKKEWQDIITNTLIEIYPDTQLYNINSQLVSAQLRNRFYWTNIPWVTIPEDRWILLSDILDSWFTDRKKSRAILESESRPLVTKDRMWHRYHNTGFTTIVYENWLDDKHNIRYFTQNELEKLQTLPVWYTKCLSRNRAAWCIWDWRTVDVIVYIFKKIK